MRTVLTDIQTRFCWKLIYMYVIPWCMSEIIDLTKSSISNGNLSQHAIFCKYICEYSFDWSTTYIMSIIVSNCQHCNEQQFRTLLCVHYTIFSVVKSDLFIQALLLDHILVTEKIYAYCASRTTLRVLRLAYILLFILSIAINMPENMCRNLTKGTLGIKIKIEFCIACSRRHSAGYFAAKIYCLACTIFDEVNANSVVQNMHNEKLIE